MFVPELESAQRFISRSTVSRLLLHIQTRQVQAAGTQPMKVVGMNSYEIMYMYEK